VLITWLIRASKLGLVGGALWATHSAGVWSLQPGVPNPAASRLRRDILPEAAAAVDSVPSAGQLVDQAAGQWNDGVSAACSWLARAPSSLTDACRGLLVSQRSE
ncbi:hypothetical protein BOX15_Mlig031802g5, partial [Macrostomum lignano]